MIQNLFFRNSVLPENVIRAIGNYFNDIKHLTCNKMLHHSAS